MESAIESFREAVRLETAIAENLDKVVSGDDELKRGLEAVGGDALVRDAVWEIRQLVEDMAMAVNDITSNYEEVSRLSRQVEAALEEVGASQGGVPGSAMRIAAKNARALR